MTRTQVETPELLKALDKLEASLAKGGDALQNQPHDGGLATEGTNIQSKAEAKKALRDLMAKSGYKDPDAILKMLSASDMGSSEEDDDNDGEGADSGDDDDAPPPELGKGGKKVKKSDTGASALDAASGVGGTRLGKSLLAADDAVRETLDAEPFIRQLVKSLGEGDDLLVKGLTRMAVSMAKAETNNQEFRKSVAQGMMLLTQQLKETQDIVQRIANTPMPGGGRSPTVRKSDIHQPDFNDGGVQGIDGRNTERSPLEDVPMMQIQEGLYELAIKSMVDITDVTKFENSKGNLNVLPQKVIKALEAKLCPAAS